MKRVIKNKNGKSLFTVLGFLAGFIAGALLLYMLDRQEEGRLLGQEGVPGAITGAALGFPVQTVVSLTAAVLGASIGGVLGLFIDNWREKKENTVEVHRLTANPNL